MCSSLAIRGAHRSRVLIPERCPTSTVQASPVQYFLCRSVLSRASKGGRRFTRFYSTVLPIHRYDMMAYQRHDKIKIKLQSNYARRREPCTLPPYHHDTIPYQPYRPYHRYYSAPDQQYQLYRRVLYLPCPHESKKPGLELGCFRPTFPPVRLAGCRRQSPATNRSEGATEGLRWPADSS